MLAPSHRLCTSFFSFIHGLSHPNRKRAAFSTTRCGDCVVVVVVVVWMSQRHAFVAYNCSHYALFRFSPPCPSCFSVIVVAVGERLAARDIFVSSIYTRKKTVSVPRCSCRRREGSGQRTHPEESLLAEKKKKILRETRSACGLDYSNLLSSVYDFTNFATSSAPIFRANDVENRGRVTRYNADTSQIYPVRV